MERKKYLEMCQKVAVLEDGEMHIKKNVPNELKVIYKGVVYYPIERVESFDNKGNLILGARIHHLKENSVVECLLKNVKEFCENEKNTKI